jgi:uncharacterized membrane protein YgcG
VSRFWLVFAALLSVTAIADERILSYHSDILVRSDGWIEVTETIQVRAEGQQIRRGIYRDYPTDYKDNLGNDYEVLYEPKSVTRNGDFESMMSEKIRNGVRTYFGRADRFLAPGIHTYTYTYHAGRMLGFFDDRDELWWNVTGRGWAFPIDEASATIRFDFDVPADGLELNAWQGPFRSDEPAVAALDDAGHPRFRATRILPPGQELSVSVRWPKGLVTEPSRMQRLTWLLTDNVNLLVALAGLAAMLGYYIPVWQSYGKDPEPGVIFTRYQPPRGYSPASLRYIGNMGYDNETMTAGVVSLAVKGYLRIDEDDGDHTLVRNHLVGDEAPLAAGERELLAALFEEGDSIELDNENHEILGGARSAHKKSLKRDYHKRYFRTNGLLNLPPLLIGIATSVVAVAMGPSVLVIATIIAMLVALIMFAIFLKQPTAVGRALLDESEGFREYLEIAEKDELNLRNPPEKTPQLFESYLPFALALGVEQQWAEKFAAIFASLRGPNDSAWQPAWYNGSSWNSIDLGSSMSSVSDGLGNSISSSVTPPGSSSSGGGGGFSGGGGGGGGGGGW